MFRFHVDQRRNTCVPSCRLPPDPPPLQPLSVAWLSQLCILGGFVSTGWFLGLGRKPAGVVGGEGTLFQSPNPGPGPASPKARAGACEALGSFPGEHARAGCHTVQRVGRDTAIGTRPTGSQSSPSRAAACFEQSDLASHGTWDHSVSLAELLWGSRSPRWYHLTLWLGVFCFPFMVG